MNWAWGQTLPPTAKLVLIALADAADDYGDQGRYRRAGKGNVMQSSLAQPSCMPTRARPRSVRAEPHRARAHRYWLGPQFTQQPPRSRDGHCVPYYTERAASQCRMLD